MAKKDLTVADQLRAHAGRASGAKYEEAQDVVAELTEQRDTAENAYEALEQLDEVSTALSNAESMVTQLNDVNIGSPSMADLLADALTHVDEANGLVSRDDLQAFVEAFDTAKDALESYGDKKEEDSYPGKRDDLEDLWADAVAGLEALADALETVEATQASEEERDREAMEKAKTLLPPGVL
jgi:hypothetical protein